MALLTTIVSISSSLILAPFLLFLLVILFLASIGKSIGVRRLYVKLLLKIFEYGRQHIEIANKHRCEVDSGFNSEDESDGVTAKLDQAGAVDTRNGHAKNGFAPTTVITREDLILAPDPHHNYGNHNSVSHRNSDHSSLSHKSSDNSLHKRSGSSDSSLHKRSGSNVSSSSGSHFEVEENKENSSPNGDCSPSNEDSKSELNVELDSTNNEPLDPNNTSKDHRRLSFETLQREFELSDCLTYIKAGMESIIEDEVTQCFEAEELKSWNLLTRTNRHYEFINTRLTVIWVLGFIIRYCFLMPLRVFICFVGAVNMVGSSLCIMFVPIPSLKRWLNKRAMLTTFRLFARGLSAVITFHNPQYAPRSSGICVANHTSPVDIVMLAFNGNYALVCWLTFCTAVVGYVPAGSFKRRLNQAVSIHCFGVLSSALSAVIKYHNPENKPARGICVANHTSPIDVLVLACDNCYALIGQRHGGFLGLLQRALARASSHIWFERSEVKDREFVTRRLRQHVSDPNNPPILIFPEGTCINNTSVMQFKKGSFEVGGDIYPVAIKYDAKFGDAFWNSSKYSMLQYLYMMMTSWAIVCDVWYLPPMRQEEGESAIHFANRVKSVIATQGGLVDLMWDGQLKRVKAKKELKERQQEEFSRHLKVA